MRHLQPVTLGYSNMRHLQADTLGYSNMRHLQPVNLGYPNMRHLQPVTRGYSNMRHLQSFTLGYPNMRHLQPVTLGYSNTRHLQPVTLGYFNTRHLQPVTLNISWLKYRQKNKNILSVLSVLWWHIVTCRARHNMPPWRWQRQYWHAHLNKICNFTQLLVVVSLMMVPTWTETCWSLFL